jgi:hypothetical protein
MLWLQNREALASSPPCVLDVSFSLAPTGLHWVLELARHLPVWLAQCHWTIVEDEGFYARDARLLRRLTQQADSSIAGGILAGTARRWRETREQLSLETRPGIFWPGDGRADSVFPKDGDAGLADRLDLLAAGLDSRRGPPTRSLAVVDAVADCARDTLALAAAMDGRRPIVLTILEPEEATPVLARELELRSIECWRLPDSSAIHAVRDPLMAAFLASGLAVPLLAKRLRLAALMIVAPRALVAPPAAIGQEELGDSLAWNEPAAEEEPDEEPGAADPWVDACALWWELP